MTRRMLVANFGLYFSLSNEEDSGEGFMCALKPDYPIVKRCVSRPVVLSAWFALQPMVRSECSRFLISGASRVSPDWVICPVSWLLFVIGSLAVISPG